MNKKTWLVIPDLHFPYEDPLYILVILHVIRRIKKYLAGVVQLGDFVDCFQISEYDRDPSRKNTVKEDVDSYGVFLSKVNAIVEPGTQWYQLEGNHEDRLRRYVWKNAPALDGMVRDFPEMLDFKVRNAVSNLFFKWFPLATWDACQIGDCVLHHGVFFGKHVAASNLGIYKTKFICGHTHRVQWIYDGKIWSATLGYGALEKKIGIKPAPNDHGQAFGILTEINGETWLETFLVKNGECVFRGEMINAKTEKR